MKLILVAITIIALVNEAKSDPSKIDRRLLSRKTSNIFITFHNGTDYILQHTRRSRFADRGAKITALRKNLLAHADLSQVKVIDYLQNRAKEQQTKYESLWISNQVFVKDATMDNIKALADLEDVKSVNLEEVIRLDAKNSDRVSPRAFPAMVPWGIDKVKASQAVSLLKASAVPASPVVVGVIDTGCRQTHETLRDNWVGKEYGWLDAVSFNPDPIDTTGRGTHVTGTLCGKGGIGVYPDAKWMACRACDSNGCTGLDLINCASFMFCPWNANGNFDCSRAPVIINNSWSLGRNSQWFDPIIAIWISADIVPIFAIGDTGPGCFTTESPGDNVDAIGVGSTDMNDRLSTSSSVGPGITGAFKPDVSAPGVGIQSASYLGDDLYRTVSGTGMAAAHVSGLIAILRAYNPSLTNADVANYLRLGADTNVVSTGQVCGGVPDTSFPNDRFGSGRINVYNSLQRLIGSVPFKCMTAGTYANGGDCHKYYRCVMIKGKLYTYDFTCPAGSYFNTDTRKCTLGNCP